MGMKRTVTRFLPVFLAILILLTQPAAALSLPAFGSLFSTTLQLVDNDISNSFVRTPFDVSPQEAAERLSYLGIVSGTVSTDGKKVFELDRAITRLETLVMVTRLLGMEESARSMSFSHPFKDVPEWGSPYVGYFYSTGILGTGDLYNPNGGISTNDFMRYMYFALGYGIGNSRGNAVFYDPMCASVYGRAAGICGEDADEISRGDAFVIILHTLQTNMRGNTSTLAETLVGSGILPKYDAYYYILCPDKDQTARYLLENGAAPQESETEGVYTVKIVGSIRCLNVAVEGENKDYDGVPVTAWECNGDVTQRFRIVLDDKGYYTIYSCASDGGYNRLLGFTQGGKAGLYMPWADQAEKFVIKKTGDGYQILSASNTAYALSTRDSSNASPVSLQLLGAYGFKQTWSFDTDGLDLLFQDGSVTPAMLVANSTAPKSAAATRLINRKNNTSSSPNAILADGGQYVISVPGAGYCLNVAVNGANKDYNGVTVNLYEETGDVSQIFRAALTESGTYKFYSCASNGGYNRVIGFSTLGKMALFSADSRFAAEFVVVPDGDGYKIHDAGNPDRVLGVGTIAKNAAVGLCDANDPAFIHTWTFTQIGTANEEGNEYALYPCNYVYITQGRYDRFSHGRQNAIDIVTGGNRAYAPFSAEIVRIDRGYYSYDAVWIQSNQPVVYADGSVDYMTVCFMHDDYIDDLKVGQMLMQGEEFYDAGTAGGASGAHVHVAVYRGQYDPEWLLTGSGDVDAEDAFFFSPEANVIVDYNYDWIRVP